MKVKLLTDGGYTGMTGFDYSVIVEGAEISPSGKLVGIPQAVLNAHGATLAGVETWYFIIGKECEIVGDTIKVKLLTDGDYSFGAEFIGQTLPAARASYESSLVLVTLPRIVGDGGHDKATWVYTLDEECEIVEDTANDEASQDTEQSPDKPA